VRALLKACRQGNGGRQRRYSRPRLRDSSQQTRARKSGSTPANGRSCAACGTTKGKRRTIRQQALASPDVKDPVVRQAAALLYPLPLAFFHAVFARSVWLVKVRGSATWRGRRIEVRSR